MTNLSKDLINEESCFSNETLLSTGLGFGFGFGFPFFLQNFNWLFNFIFYDALSFRFDKVHKLLSPQER